VTDEDLVISTHGRGFWVLYDIAPLRQLNAEVAEEPVHLFDPVDPLRGLDYGVQVVYHLRDAADSVSLEFADAAGNVIQTFSAAKDEKAEAGGAEDDEEEYFLARAQPKPSLDAGSHTFRWNLRYPGYTEFKGRIFWAAGNYGPVAVPGRYTVTLRADSVEQSQEFEIGLDPRLRGQVTVQQLQQRFDLALRIRNRVTDANEAVIRIREFRAAIDQRLEQTDDRGIRRQAETVKNRLAAVEEQIYQVKNRSSQDPLNFPIKLNNKLAALMGVVESAAAPPTAQSYEVFDYLSGKLQEQLDRLDAVVSTDLTRLNEMLTAKGMEHVEVEKPEKDGL